MALFVVIKKSIKEGLMAQSNSQNPTERELISDLKSYQQVYLLSSLEDAIKVSELFFNPSRPPKAGGSYGVIAEVTAEFSDMPVTFQVDTAAIHNNWIDSGGKGFKKDNTGMNCPCMILSPTQIKSISQIVIPENAKAYNPNLQNVDFKQVQPGLCLLM